MRRPQQLLVTGATAILLVAGAATAVAAPDTPPTVDDDAVRFAAAPVIGSTDVSGHLEAFQQIADSNDGNRAAGTSGYAASVDYVAQVLTDLGFDVTRDTCTSCQYDDDNLIADWPGDNASSTIMLGAHLDGVAQGAGLNDNASGSAALLAAASAIASTDAEFTRHVRLAWWAEEELGMHGSAHYVADTGVSDIDAYVNLDMVGGVNAGYFVDNLAGALAQPFASYLDDVGFPAEEMTDCCSDDSSFAQAGVPTTLLSTGYGELKTVEQAAKWGGTAGEPFDPCYHTACDTYPENIDTGVLLRMANAAVHGLWETADRPGDLNPYTPVQVCGESYRVLEQEPVSVGGERYGTVYLLWSSTNADNCALVLKDVAVGSPSQMALLLEAEDGRSVGDDGAFGYYAGPAKLDAGGTCVAVTASIVHDGRTAEGAIPMGHCG
ncbi:MAG TPA: M20/M25/M40 family metallo-hydrolase [Candidatus Stackebrandtia excrementipullorum]|nr:M20/M25/M40 family metallo-hydrolase [Candidatus Stackebrandtia excrementipullorum]